MSKQAKWTPGPDLAYLVVFLESNLPEIAESTGYDVAAVAGDAASLGRMVRTAPQMAEALRTLLTHFPNEYQADATVYHAAVVGLWIEKARAALRAAGVPDAS